MEFLAGIKLTKSYNVKQPSAVFKIKIMHHYVQKDQKQFRVSLAGVNLNHSQVFPCLTAKKKRRFMLFNEPLRARTRRFWHVNAHVLGGCQPRR